MPVLKPKRKSNTTLIISIFNPLLLKGLPPKNNRAIPNTSPKKPISEPKAIRKSIPPKISEKYDPTSISNQNCNIFTF